MKHTALHSWQVTTEEAKQIQYRLGGMIDTTWDGRKVKTVAGADVAFPDKRTVLAAVVVLTFPDLTVIDTCATRTECTFPYVPGLLAFREVPGLLRTFEALRAEPDLLMCDAQGMAHPRRMGLATHVGILVGLPVIGCAKSWLYGSFGEVAPHRGAYSHMLDTGGAVVGAAVRTRAAVEPVYVSVGNKIDLERAIEFVLACSLKYRIPEPLRLAHKLSKGENLACERARGEQELF